MTFHSVGKNIFPTDQLIFFRGVSIPPTRMVYDCFTHMEIENGIIYLLYTHWSMDISIWPYGFPNSWMVYFMEIRKSNGGWLGIPPFQQTSIWYPDSTVVFFGIYSLLVFYPILLWYTYLDMVYDRRYHYFHGHIFIKVLS